MKNSIHMARAVNRSNKKYLKEMCKTKEPEVKKESVDNNLNILADRISAIEAFLTSMESKNTTFKYLKVAKLTERKACIYQGNVRNQFAIFTSNSIAFNRKILLNAMTKNSKIKKIFNL